jgi:hypothetical protein
VRPSPAQARLLGCIDDHGRDGDEVLAGIEGRNELRWSLYVERLGSQVDSRETPMSIGLGHSSDTDILLRPASLPRVGQATVHACVTRGWLDTGRTREVTTPCIGVCWKGWGDGLWTARFACVDITDDGRIALGLWRQRQMAAPPTPVPRLEGRDREIVALADAAQRLGFALAPTSVAAKGAARRLKREGWVTRGFIGASTGSVLPSPSGQVEVHPDSADIA